MVDAAVWLVGDWRERRMRWD